MNAITDVGGIRVGHHHRLDPDVTLGNGWASGTTVVLTPPGTVGAVDGRGGAPGTRETDLLDPINSVRHVDAVVLSGGSAFGLATADGVMTWLEERDRGVAMEGGVVPIVPAAVIFDLPVGGWQNRPTAEFGYASLMLESGVTVGALVVVNAAGDAVDPATGLPWLADQIEQFGLVAPPADEIAAYADRHTELSPLNTTIAVVATDAALSKAGCRRVAVAAQDGLARTIRPCHTPLDGDTVFALATGAVEVPPDPTTPGSMSPETRLITDVGAAAADCLARAVLVGVLAAEAVAGIPSYRDMLPGAFE
jgi:L-aminopeptidase/D-esterase-like protein